MEKRHICLCIIDKVLNVNNMALFRKLSSFIEEFYRDSRNALLLTGARQTGKTFSVREFGKNFESFIEINFIETPEAVDIFKSVSNPRDILLRVSAFTDKKMIPGRTLIFFDEVQECKEAMTYIKFLVDDGTYRYILSGSLLGVELKGLRSNPVGYIGIKDVYPLDFEEFIINIGVNRDILSYLLECFTKREPVAESIHLKLLELVRLYLVTGGMPAAVDSYISTNNLQNVEQIQKDIISLYKEDIAKYGIRDRLEIKEVFDLIPSELDAKNKRFILKRLNEHAKYERCKNSFLWLKDAGVAIPVYNVSEPKVPLKLSENRNLFKLFSNDVGLLCAQYGGGLQLKIITGNNNINFGAVFENFIAQELLAHGIQPFYFNSKRLGELDFVVAVGGAAVPIEVKSGKDYTVHRAILNVIECKNYEIEEGIVFSNSNLSVKEKIVYAPVYMVMFLKGDAELPRNYKIDISALR